MRRSLSLARSPVGRGCSYPLPTGERDRPRQRPGRGFVAAALLLVAGCGLSPIYGGGPSGIAARTLAGVRVAPIPERAGYFVRQALLTRVGAPEDARYRLEVALDDRVAGFGIRADTTISRERRSLRARYRLVETATNTVVLDATAGADEGIDVVQSPYAVVAAEQTALERLSVRIADQIVARVALYARQAARAAPTGGDAVPADAPPLPGAAPPSPGTPGA